MCSNADNLHKIKFSPILFSSKLLSGVQLHELSADELYVCVCINVQFLCAGMYRNAYVLMQL